MVVLLIHSDFNPFTVVMVATVGNYLGACTTYYIGSKRRTGIIGKYLLISQEQLAKTDRLFQKFGVYAFLFTWVSGIIKKGKAWKQEDLIVVLDPIIGGWTNYHQSLC